MLSEKTGRETGKEPAVEYAANKVEAAERRMGSETTSVVWRGGKRLAVKKLERMQMRQREREAIPDALDVGKVGRKRGIKRRPGW